MKINPSSKLAALVASAWNRWNADCGTNSGQPATPDTLGGFTLTSLRRACIYYNATGKFAELFTRSEMDAALSTFNAA